MTPDGFHAAYRPTANQVSAGTGIDPIALLAQWANETSWGTSWAGAPYNLGNIENNGVVIHYASLDAFAQACIATFHLPQYAGVLAATNAVDQLAAIVASPWAANHYGGSLMGFYSPLEGFELTPEEHAMLVRTLGNSQSVNDAVLYGEGTPNPANTFSQLFDAKIHAIVRAELAKLTLGGLTPAQDAKLTQVAADTTAIRSKTDRVTIT
ncbi:MAG TPA: glucosaminidase domain-containing protein [Candidatus Dormibacteraeota bacterium]|nr:glucosaminidase domain-containing protein [Candidatus Dormibacteraeota bacterium]